MSIQFIESHLSRGVMIRVRPGNDLILAIEEACDRAAIRSGSISCCVGSLRKASFMFLVPFDNRMGSAYCDPVTIEAPWKSFLHRGPSEKMRAVSSSTSTDLSSTRMAMFMGVI